MGTTAPFVGLVFVPSQEPIAVLVALLQVSGGARREVFCIGVIVIPGGMNHPDLIQRVERAVIE